MEQQDNPEQLFPDHPGPWPKLLWITAIAVVYFVVARISLALVFQPEGIAAIWPPGGIFLAALLLTRRELRPYLAGVLCLTDWMAQLLTGTSWLISLTYALVLTGDAYLSCWLLLRFVGGPIRFNRTRELLGFLVLAIFFSNGLAALVAASATQLLPGTSFWNSWRWWATSDGIGSIIVTPLLISWAAWFKNRLRGWNPSRFLEGLALFVFLALLNWFIFGHPAQEEHFILLTYLTFPCLLWAALRFGVRGVSLSALLLAAITVYFITSEQYTSIVLMHDFKLDAVITVQLYLVIMTIPTLFLATVVTEGQQTEETLAQERNMLRTLIDAIPDNIYIKDTTSHFLVCNMALARSMGKQVPEEIYGKTDFDFHTPEFAQQYFTDEQEIFRSGQPLISHEELAFNASTKRLECLITTKMPLRDQQDRIWGLVGISRDITERQQIREQLRLAHERLELATRAARLGVWDWDLHTKEFIWDDQMYKLYGIKNQDSGMAYQAWLDRLHPDDRARQDELVQKAQRGDKTYNTEFRVIWPDGTIHFLKAYGQVSRDSDGRPLRMTGMNFDITEQKQAEEEIRQLNVELEQRVAHRTAQLQATNRELESFAYSISHDLRAPLRAISGFTGLLLEDYRSQLDQEGQRLCHIINRNTQKMGRLIDDLLSFSRLSRAAIQTSLIDMTALFKTVWAEITTPESLSRIDFQLAPLPPARGDPAMIRQVIINLLDNAIKFSSLRERAVITITGKKGRSENTYSVVDNGAGFDMKYVDKLFGVFQRLHTEQEFDGTGVGLAIVHRIIHRHGGRIWVEAALNQGATFYFTIPKEANWHESQ